jgi:hypothetical protein
MTYGNSALGSVALGAFFEQNLIYYYVSNASATASGTPYLGINRTFLVGGILVFDGTPGLNITRILNAFGGITINGTSWLNITRIIDTSGGMTTYGANLFKLILTPVANGTAILSGTDSSLNILRNIIGAGGLSADGTLNLWISIKLVSVNGGLLASGWCKVKIVNAYYSQSNSTIIYVPQDNVR